jgi:tetraacyldisaccharide 4'-kinase
MQPGTDSTLSRLSRPFLNLLSLGYKTAALCNLLAQALRRRTFPAMFIISVDSLSFGGAGKTPLVMAIGQALQARGARFAVVSRGYRSHSEKTGARVVTGQPCAEVGDEALMIKTRFPGQEVFIGRDRLRSIAAAAALDVRIIILDDGFQSSHIRKDISVMLVNPTHPYYYLRHFRFLTRRADLLLSYRQGLPPGGKEDGAGYDFAISAFFDACSRPVDISGTALVAFSALGDNQRFAGDMGRFRLAAFRGFADHHAFTPTDLRSLEALRKEKGADWLICTEKDFCKIQDLMLADTPGADRAGAPGTDLRGIPLLYARNEIQLPGGVIAAIVEHAAKKGFI